MNHRHAWILGCALWPMAGLAQVPCGQAQFDPAVRGAPVRLMTHVETDSLMPDAPHLTGGAHVQPTPGVSGPALALGSILGNLLIGQLNASQQRTAAQRTVALKAVLGRSAPGVRLHDGLKAMLSGAGFAELRHEPSADSFDMEQPGLLRRIEEPHILTAHASYGWTGGGLDTPWVKMRLRLWAKGGHRPVLCRDYTYLGSATVAGDDDEAWKAAVERFLADSALELASMAEVDAREPAAPAPAVLLKAHIPPLGEEPAAPDKLFVSVAEHPERWLVRAESGDAPGRLWSLPKPQVQVREGEAKAHP